MDVECRSIEPGQIDTRYILILPGQQRTCAPNNKPQHYTHTHPERERERERGGEEECA